ncbi:peroxisomal membrane protein PEX13 [Euwallacea fornicatus]|uniref:peroxisomal membrane protein PEX13 n=1 Tax=Euwallacea fornicatus TaxID=995702 RepID=UPI0033903B72
MNSAGTPWETSLLNSGQFMRSQSSGGPIMPGRPSPVLPPRPSSSSTPLNSYSSMSMPYGFSSYNSPYGSYGGFGTVCRNSLYGGYSGGSMYNNYSMFNNPMALTDDHERRFIQFAEENSKQTFASVESVVRAFNSLAMMLDNTFFAMTSSFRAILGVAENFGRLRTMFGHIWYSVNVFRFISWLYRKFRLMLGLKVSHSPTSLAWKEASASGGAVPSPGGSGWPTLAFLGVIVSASYMISKFLPKYQDKLDPANWKSSGIKAKACFDFIPTSHNELTMHTNDNITLAPTYLQEELHLKNTGWALAEHNGKSGLVPLNYIVINKSGVLPESANREVLVPRMSNIKDSNGASKSQAKRVSFGDIEIFENGEDAVRIEKLPADEKS